jgi:hypothetical protein
MKSLIFSEYDIEAWQAGEKTLHFLKIKVQPDMIWEDSLPWWNVGGLKGGKQPFRPGDKIYIRETWRVGAWDEYENKICVDYKAGGFCRKEWLSVGKGFNDLWRDSTDDADRVFGHQNIYKWEPGQSPCRWRPPVTMPECAARYHAIVKDITPEKVGEEWCWIIELEMETE